MMAVLKLFRPCCDQIIALELHLRTVEVPVSQDRKMAAQYLLHCLLPSGILAETDDGMLPFLYADARTDSWRLTPINVRQDRTCCGSYWDRWWQTLPRRHLQGCTAPWLRRQASRHAGTCQ